ncbi:fanconi-associated nuclease 1-like isoform X3 [Zophobas morio]|uniref:fanconi-associated nuclease 1-like isoform X3 n=1 Tax=Zophobas morio TaxID=2755281 RepID=UPI0030839511
MSCTSFNSRFLSAHTRTFLLFLKSTSCLSFFSRFFNDEDLFFLNEYFSLDESVQYLFIRLYERKKDWIKKSSLIDYKEIILPIEETLDVLLKKKFLELLDFDNNFIDFKGILFMLTLSELLLIAKSHKINLKGKTKTKANVIECIVKTSRLQRSILENFSRKRVILKDVKSALGLCVRVHCKARFLIDRVMTFSFMDRKYKETEVRTLLAVYFNKLKNTSNDVNFALNESLLEKISRVKHFQVTHAALDALPLICGNLPYKEKIMEDSIFSNKGNKHKPDNFESCYISEVDLHFIELTRLFPYNGSSSSSNSQPVNDFYCSHYGLCHYLYALLLEQQLQDHLEKHTLIATPLPFYNFVEFIKKRFSIECSSGSSQLEHLDVFSLYYGDLFSYDKADDKQALREEHCVAVKPPHLFRPTNFGFFCAGHVYSRILSVIVTQLEKLKNYQLANEILRLLLSQCQFGLNSRGRWWERLTVNLRTQSRDLTQCALECRNGLADPHVRSGHRMSLEARLKKITVGKGKSKQMALLSLPEYTLLVEPPTVFIKAMKAWDNVRGFKRFYIVGPAIDTVENTALVHYEKQGWNGLHSQNLLFRTLFALALWDIIFSEDFEDSFVSPYQSLPLDFYCDTFYKKRSIQITKRLDYMKEMNVAELHSFFKSCWHQHYGKFFPGISWDLFTLEQLLSIVEGLGTDLLTGVIMILAKDYRHRRSGMPDLTLWQTDPPSCKFVEVKSTNDRMSWKQWLWAHDLLKLGADYEIGSVQGGYYCAILPANLSTFDGPNISIKLRFQHPLVISYVKMRHKLRDN